MGYRGAIVGLGVLVVGVAAAAAAGLAGAGGWWALSAASAGGVAGAFVPSLVSAVLDARRHRIETRAALEAASARVEASPELSPAKLLSPDRGVVAFRGRERELAELRAWCLGEGRPVRALVGAGGIGKTRLVRQLAADLAAQGWQCRFVRQDHEAQIVDLTVAGAREPLLLVVDYAETAVDLAHMLEAVVRVPERVRLRVLLVARGIGEWWDRLESATFQAPSLLAPPLVLAPGLGEGVELEQVVQDALRDFGRVLGLTPPRAEIVLNQAAPPVLVVHAAALVALLGARDTAREPVRVRVETGVLGELLRHEAVYWRRSAEPAGLAELDATTRRRVVAVACVADAPDEAGAASLLEAVPDLRGSPEAVRRKTARWLRQLYTPASPQTWFGSLQPDLLAERHVVEQFTASPDLADACVAGMAGERARRPLTVLARAMDHDDRALAVTGRLITLHPGLVAPAIEVAIGAGERLAGLLTSVLPGLAMPPEAVDRADAALPGSTVLLAEVAVLLARRMLEEVPLDTDPRTPVWRSQHLALRLAQVGRSAQALPYNEQAVAICRELVEDDPERFTPVLAAAVNDLSVRLYEVGRTADALPYAEEAVRLLRASVEHDQELRPALAAALLNLGVWLWRTERASDAVPYTGEAVLLYEDLMHTTGGRFLPDWAAALDNLGVQLHAVGQLEEAVRRTTLAVAMRLQLAEAAPDQYEPDAARTLTNAGMILRDAGRTEEARGALRRAVTMLRDLEQRHPGRFQVPLLRALNGLLQVGVVGAEERSAAREVLVLSAEQLPPERRPVTELMIRQADLDEEAVRHEQAHRRREAVYCLTDALAVGRQIARLEPQVHDADLAQRLNRLGHELIGFDDLPGALCYFEEAVSLQRRVVARDPATPLEPLAHYLRNLGQWRLAANQERDAIPTLEGAVLTHEVLARADARHERNLALVLGDLMAALALTGDFARAVPYGQRALEIWERQARTDPNGSHDRLLSCLINLATCHEALGDPASADHYTQRANTVQHPRRPLDRREDE